MEYTVQKLSEVAALKDHRIKLLKKKKQIEILLSNVNNTIALKEGVMKMSDKEKFEGFKSDLIDKNEKSYGKEIRKKYGDNVVDESNKKFQGMSQEKYNEFIKLAEDINIKLLEAFKSGDPTSKLAQEVAELHKNWLLYTWTKYSKEAHAGLAEMYVYDERFKAYYDKDQDGLAEFLRDSILYYVRIK